MIRGFELESPTKGLERVAKILVLLRRTFPPKVASELAAEVLKKARETGVLVLSELEDELRKGPPILKE